MGPGRRVLAVVVAASALLLALMSGASAAGPGSASTSIRWMVREATVPAGGDAKALQLSATECPSSTTCVSVGTDDGPVGRSIVAGRETTVRVPLPADRMGFSADVDLLSCASATFCVAAGEYTADDPTFAAFFATWDGATWRTVRAPAPVPSDDPYGELQALSCGAPGHCTAVSLGTVYTLANGTWTASAPQLPTGTDNPRLAGVSCPTATYCVVTGTADAGRGIAPVVLVQDGSTRTALRLPNPSGWPSKLFGPSLLGLDCAAARHCVIVAGDQRSPRYLVSLDRTHVTYHRVAVPAHGATSSYVDEPRSVSCPTTPTCWVLDGYHLKGTSEYSEPVPVAVRLQRGKVRTYGLPSPSPRRSARPEIDDLACPTASSCVAVGSRRTNDGDPPYREAVIETLSGGTWRASLAPVPTGAPQPRAYELSQVSCGAPGRCVADGAYQWDLRDGDDDFHFTQRRAVLAQLGG